MDSLLEFIADLFMEIIVEGSKESRIPKPLRIFLFILFLVIFFALVGVFLFAAVKITNIMIKLLFVGLAIGVVIFIISHIRNALK